MTSSTRRCHAAVSVTQPEVTGRISTEEVYAMTEGNQSAPAGTKTLGVALPDELHAQFGLVAGLKNLSLKDAVRQAVELWIQQSRSELAERAQEAMAEIERDAALRRDALAALFGPQTSEATELSKPAGRRGRESAT
jgi:hypothetical protein